MSAPEIVALVLVALGEIALLACCVGGLRRRGAAAELHYVGVASSVAVPLVAIGCCLHHGLSSASLRTGLVAVVALALGPVSIHALARTSYHRARLQREGDGG